MHTPRGRLQSDAGSCSGFAPNLLLGPFSKCHLSALYWPLVLWGPGELGQVPNSGSGGLSACDPRLSLWLLSSLRGPGQAHRPRAASPRVDRKWAAMGAWPRASCQSSVGVWADGAISTGCPSSLHLLDPGAWADDLHGFPTPSPAPIPSLQLPPRGLGQCAETLRPGERPVRLPASRHRTGLQPLQPRLLRPPAREGLPEVGGVRLWVHCP